MKAMLFAAGLGTRLKPYTNSVPKALVPLNGKPILQHNIERLYQAGFHEIVINIHHFADKVTQFLQTLSYPGLTIHISDEQEQLLETGGGLVKAKELLGKEPFLVHNVDVLSTIDLQALYNHHLKTPEALATLAVRNTPSDRYLLFNPEQELIGWQNVKTGEEIMARSEERYHRFSFTGIQVINPVIFDHISEHGAFSITPVYLRLAQNHVISAFECTEDHWIDIGTPEKLKEAEEWFF